MALPPINCRTWCLCSQPALQGGLEQRISSLEVPSGGTAAPLSVSSVNQNLSSAPDLYAVGQLAGIFDLRATAYAINVGFSGGP